MLRLLSVLFLLLLCLLLLLIPSAVLSSLAVKGALRNVPRMGEVINLVDSSDDDEPARAVKRVRASSPPAAASAASAASAVASASAVDVYLLTYNTDGLDNTRCPVTRAIAQCKIISAGYYHVIHLQEVIGETLPVFKNLLVDYECIEADSSKNYFSTTFIHKGGGVQLLESYKASCKMSAMGRGHIFVKVKISGCVMAFVNMHMESCVESAPIRMHQTSQLLNICMRLKEPCVIAGDLNARNNEIGTVCHDLQLKDPYAKKTKASKASDTSTQEGVGSDQLIDAFVAAGSRGLSVTWQARDNPFRARFDRALYLHRDGFYLTSYEVCMTEKLFKESSGAEAVTLSDHLGVVVKFRVESSAASAIYSSSSHLRNQNGDGFSNNNSLQSTTINTNNDYNNDKIKTNNSTNQNASDPTRDGRKRVEREARLKRFT